MRIVRKLVEFLGFFPLVMITNLRNIGWYIRDYRKFNRLGSKDFKLSKPFPVLNEKNSGSGVLSGHYFHQDLWVAQQIFKDKPNRHVDVGSRTDGFVTHVASFREIEVLDIRQPGSAIKNISFKVADLMDLSPDLLNYTESLSCLHVIEHFGLGRYGDSIDPDGHQKGWQNLYDMQKPGGTFYFSTPIGPQRIEFNAHRVFSIGYLLSWIRDKYEIETFCFVDDNGDFHADIELTDEVINTNAGCWFGCGIFKLRKFVS